MASIAVPLAISAVIALINIDNAAHAQKRAKRKAEGRERASRNGFLINTRASDEPIKVVYGKSRVGGNQAYLNARGTTNEYFDIILTLSEGPVESIENIWLDDKLISTFGSVAYYEFFNGAAAQGLCTTLQAADSSWINYQRGTAYIYLRLQFDQTKFNGMPTVTVELKGRTLYDPRDGVTAWSDNPALVWYDLMTDTTYGLGEDSSNIDLDTVRDAANWCEANGYTFNGAIWEKKAFIDTLSDIMRNFRAYTSFSDGKHQLKILNYDTPVMSFDEDEIVADSFGISIPGLADTPNRIKVEYPDILDKYVIKDVVVADETAVLQYDLEERDASVVLNGTTDATQARKLATYILERESLNKSYSIVVHQRAIALDPGDLIKVTHTLPGWVDTILRVEHMAVTNEGLIQLSLQDETSLLYDDIVNVSSHTYFSTNLPDPLDIPDEVTGVSFIEEEYFNKDVSYTRLKISYTAPTSPFWKQSQVWIDVDGGGYNQYLNVTGSLSVDAVKEGVVYKVKFISESIHGMTQDFATATEWSYTVIGKNTPPDDVTGFQAIPQADTVVLMWDGVSNLDLLGYAIRAGANWENGVFIDFKKGETVQLNGVAPGTHTYMIKSVDTNGVFSTNYALASATVYGPPTYTETMSEYNDFSEPATWVASTTYALGDRVLPTVANTYEYECTTIGTTGGTEPTWPTTNGGTVTDGTVVWTAYETHVFTNTERYSDPDHGWVLRGARDTVGSDLVTNGGFATDTSSWTATRATLSSIAGGQSGNCLEVSRDSGDSQEAYQTIITEIGKPYQVDVYVKSGTSGDEAFVITITGIVVESGDTTSSWVKHSMGFVATSTTSVITLTKNTATVGTMLFDTVVGYEYDVDGTYVSPVYDRGSSITRRAWPLFDLVFIGTGTAWIDQFDSADIWTDKLTSSDTWLALFGSYSAGSVVMELGYSTNGTTWLWLPYFEAYANEVQAQYVKYRITQTDIQPEGYVYVKPGTYKEAYKL